MAHRVGCCGLAVADLTPAAAFFGFPTSGFVVALDLGSGFLGLGMFLVVVTLRCFGASVTD